ncbi:hypothetical protein SCHPADRAFT_867654 [Schizopora paradoxa]|uniref:Uncharacterized protein n=1 Tax=Schizopora paradoxa TaxID=27342 RepID=A0A0H2S1P1_9AGAM|nr:hypothetical protein SCHPADRAFT_867654 [Schizopora paradoxa]
MYLIGAAISTHKWPSTTICGTGKQCDVLITINAFSWMIFGLISIAFTLILMHYAAATAAESPSSSSEKTSPAMTTA